MFRSVLRFTSIAPLLLGMVVSRNAQATDIVSPASVNAADSPNVLFNQTGVDSFPPYQWAIVGNDSTFFVRDVSNGGQVPFAIAAGSDSYLLWLEGSNVGIGTHTPAAGLHLRKAAQASTAEIMARFETTDDPVGGLFIANSSAGDGVFVPKITGRSASTNAALINEAIITNDIGASPAIAYNAVKGAGGALVTRPLVVYRNNGAAKATIAANGDVTATSFNPTSSRTIKHDIVDLSSRKASDALHQLTPVEFVYNDDESNEKRVGFIAEDVPELVAAKDRLSVPIMDVVALVTRVVKDQDRVNEQQQKTIDQQRLAIESLTQSNAAQQKRLEALERLLTSKTISGAQKAP